MRVALLLNYFLPEHAAGTEVYVLALAKSLLQLDVEVCVLIPHYGQTVSAQYAFEGVPVFQYAEPSTPSRSIQIGQTLPQGLTSVVQFYQDWKPDLVHVHEIAGSTGIRVEHLELAHGLGIKTVYTLHLATITCSTGTLFRNQTTLCDGIMQPMKCSRCILQKQTNSPQLANVLTWLGMPFFWCKVDPRRFAGRIGTALSAPMQVNKLQIQLRRLTAVVDQFVPITDWYERMLLENGVASSQLTCIKQAIPVQLPSIPVIRAPWTNSRPVRLLFVGRISPLKGIDLLLNALSSFDVGMFELTVMGSAVDKAFVDQMQLHAERLGMVHWLGKTSSEEVMRAMASHDVLVLPSVFSEMSPLVIQEAFQLELPVLGSNVYGIAELIHEGMGGQGWLFQMGSLDALRKQLAQCRLDLLQHGTSRFQFPEPRSFQWVGMETKQVYTNLLEAAAAMFKSGLQA